MLEFLPAVLEAVDIEGVATNLIEGDFEDAPRELFSEGDLRGPDFAACDGSYQSMSFGAGAEVGVFAFDAGGEIGIVWGLTSSNAGVESYTATGASAGGLRLFSVDVTSAFGIWKLPPLKLRGDLIGLSLGVHRKIDLRKLKNFGVSGGISLWFGCGLGEGDLVTNPLCELREDSDFLVR